MVRPKWAGLALSRKAITIQPRPGSVDDQALAKDMRLVSMSFDPEYDTPQRLAAYSEAIRETKSGCEWRFATAKSRAELESILVAYGQTVDKRRNTADPQEPLYHILRVFLIDREGRIRKHLQFRHARPPACPCRRENLAA